MDLLVQNVVVVQIQCWNYSQESICFSEGKFFGTRSNETGAEEYTIPASNAFGLPDCHPAVLRQLVREKSLKPFRKYGGKNEDDPVYLWNNGGRYDRRGYDVPYADQPSVQA